MLGPFKYGVFIKKSLYEKEAQNPKSGETVIATRTRLAMAAFNLHTYSEEAVKLMMEKHVNACPTFSAHFAPFEG